MNKNTEKPQSNHQSAHNRGDGPLFDSNLGTTQNRGVFDFDLNRYTNDTQTDLSGDDLVIDLTGDTVTVEYANLPDVPRKESYASILIDDLAKPAAELAVVAGGLVGKAAIKATLWGLALEEDPVERVKTGAWMAYEGAKHKLLNKFVSERDAPDFLQDKRTLTAPSKIRRAASIAAISVASITGVVSVSAEESGADTHVAMQQSSDIEQSSFNVEATPEEERINELMDRFVVGEAYDLKELTEALADRYIKYSPNDIHRRPETPEGYVKVMLQSESPGIDVPFAVAERTTAAERYTSPQGYAVYMAYAKIVQDVAQNYPGLESTVAYLRDFDSPFHKTHSKGLAMDVATSLSTNVSQYADGPVGDYRSSNAVYNEQMTMDVIQALSKLNYNGESVIDYILYSDKEFNKRANSELGTDNFIQYSSNHQEHFHIHLEEKFALPAQGLRAGNFSFDVNQDLKIDSEARTVGPFLSYAEHKDHLDWQVASGQLVPSEDSPMKTVEQNPELLYDLAFKALREDISKYEGTVDDINTGLGGDTVLGSDKYLEIMGDRKPSELTVAEIIKMQKAGSFRAVGKYQIIPETMDMVIKGTGMDTTRLFDEAAQNEMFEYLMLVKRPAVAAYIHGSEDNVSLAANALAEEWASMPFREYKDGGLTYNSRYGNVGNNASKGGEQRYYLITDWLAMMRLAYAEMNSQS